MDVSNIFSNVEEVLSVCSFVVALSALLFTAWQFIVQRKHNRISVKPHLIRTSRTSKRDNSVSLEVILINNGLGPAYINNFQIFHKGQVCDPNAELKNVFGDLIRNSSFTILGDDYAISEKESVVLLSICFTFKTESEVDAVSRKIDEFDILIEYSSAYEKIKPLDSRTKIN